MNDQFVNLYKKIWVPVAECPEHYHVSNFGMVKRVSTGRGAVAGRVLRTQMSSGGYPMVQLVYDGKRRSRTIHRIMMESFSPDGAAQGFEVNHIDGNKTNNLLENLEWTTRSGNMKHAYMNGLRCDVGEKNGRSILTRKQANEIRSMKGKKTQRLLAEEFGVSIPTISAIWTGRNWQ